MQVVFVKEYYALYQWELSASTSFSSISTTACLVWKEARSSQIFAQGKSSEDAHSPSPHLF